jgi:hypothetical protein
VLMSLTEALGKLFLALLNGAVA